MAFDCFLKIDGIDGESRDDRHPKEIEVLSFSWGESNTGAAAHGGGGGAGKVSMQDFTFTMRLNRASPLLAKACATGQHIKSAVLTCRKPGASIAAVAAPAAAETPGGVDVVPIDVAVAVVADGFFKFTLTDLLVSSYQTSASVLPRSSSPGSTDQTPPAAGDGLPVDAVALGFAKVEMEVQVQRPDGSFGPPVKAGWDLKQNRAV